MTFSNQLFILDSNGDPHAVETVEEWAAWFKHADRTLRHTEVWGTLVSTVFLGLNHRCSKNGSPVLWETMIFGGMLNGYQWRYCTSEEALTGHREAVFLARWAPFFRLSWWWTELVGRIEEASGHWVWEANDHNVPWHNQEPYKV